jgi:hypothetical protein
MFLRRLGNDASGPSLCARSCPDILELADGDFAIIGADITTEAADRLPLGSGCGPEERIVRIPRALLLRARRDIPAA